jgi:hypothetical protein
VRGTDDQSVLVVEDNAGLRQAFVPSLGHQPDIEEVA